MSAELHPSGFRIGSRAIAASFAHPASFQPLENRPPDEYSLISTPAVGGSDSGWCAYWDQSAFMEVQEFQVDPDTIADLMVTSTEGDKKKEKKKDKAKHSAQKCMSYLCMRSTYIPTYAIGYSGGIRWTHGTVRPGRRCSALNHAIAIQTPLIEFK